MGEKVSDVAGDVGVGTEGEADTFFETGAEKVELERVLVVIDLGRHASLREHSGDRAIKVAGNGTMHPREITKGMGEHRNRISKEALNIAQPSSLQLGIGGCRGVNPFHFVHRADKVVPTFGVPRGKTKTSAAEEIDLETEADTFAKNTAQFGDKRPISHHATAPRGGPDTFNKSGIGLPMELEGVGGKVEGEGMLDEALALGPEGEGERRGILHVNATSTIGELRMRVAIAKPRGKQQGEVSRTEAKMEGVISFRHSTLTTAQPVAGGLGHQSQSEHDVGQTSRDNDLQRHIAQFHPCPLDGLVEQ